ncbi:hypothetical protein LTR70_000483 [Exophiala xenobiotica]|nr:hypothetical protein LTR70_000483 [Exophiala xenobiotica]
MSRTSERPYINLVLDFDGTLTRKDTMDVLAGAGYARQRKARRDPPPRPWNEVVDAYISDFKAHTDAYLPHLPATGDSTTYEQEKAWLNSLRPIEIASIERAIKAGVFDQLSAADMAVAADKALDSGQVQLRNGWTELFSLVEQHNAKFSVTDVPNPLVQVVSVNWSACFVRQVLHACIQHAPEVEDRFKSLWSSHIAVYANELPSIARDDVQMGQAVQSRAERQHLQGIRTSGDKVSMFMSIRDNMQYGMNTTSIYVGDSSTDLECLLAADAGICIRDEPMGSGQKDLAATCERLGIEVVHVGDKHISSTFTTMGQRHGLLWARDFSEINEWLRRRNAYRPKLPWARLVRFALSTIHDEAG